MKLYEKYCLHKMICKHSFEAHSILLPSSLDPSRSSHMKDSNFTGPLRLPIIFDEEFRHIVMQVRMKQHEDDQHQNNGDAYLHGKNFCKQFVPCKGKTSPGALDTQGIINVCSGFLLPRRQRGRNSDEDSIRRDHNPEVRN